MKRSKIACLLLLCPVCLISFAQTATKDSTGLEEVIIKAYGQNNRLRNVPAAVNHIGSTTLERFSPGSIVQAVNTTPGIRMEERSPGSYRFSIRGSSLRSPFGVRNVKIYFNDIPITDPGGHSYLNQLGYYNFRSIDVIKGPGSSFYGAGTGGVLLIESLAENDPGEMVVEYSRGSYGLENIYGGITSSNENVTSKIGFQHQSGDGYRAHSESKREVLSWNGIFRLNENKVLRTSFLYGNLFYETPGALTRAEYDANPRSARPGNAFFPGAEAAGASIRQKQFIAGASYDQDLTSQLRNKTVLYGMFTELLNPTIQNYGRSSEPHFGARTVFHLNAPAGSTLFRFDLGAEHQTGFTNVSIYKNAGGRADSLRTFDEIHISQSFVFSQATLDRGDLSLTAGGSLNFLNVGLERFAPASSGRQKRRFSNQFAPRLAVLYKFGEVSLYASLAKGFSPPTTAELIPTGGAINLDLNAEKGINYDMGLKGNLAKGLSIDVNAFAFKLKNTIVQRRTAGGGDYFLNAGKTRQMGVETYLGYSLLPSLVQAERSLLWISHSFHYFHYREFKQLENDYSGNRIPSEPKNAVSAGYDFLARNGLLGTISYFYSGRIPLNDANTEYAAAFSLLGAKIGYQAIIKDKLRIRFTVGGDNLLDEKYSLGNDINGFGGRYFNAAAGRNYYASLVLQLKGRLVQ